MNIILTGGGTAGHVTANLALLPYLSNCFDEIHYIGSSNGVEKKLLAPYKNVVFHEITCEKFRRSLSLKNLLLPFKLIKGIIQAKKIIKKIKPAVIFSKGGFVGLPVVFAANKVPIVIHESDKSMGLANKLSAKVATTVCTTFPFSIQNKRFVHTGTPIRSELFDGNRKAIFDKYKIDKPVVLIMGGSLGASAINLKIREQLPTLTKDYFIIHLCGKGKLLTSINNQRYVQLEYEPNPASLFAAADYVITRGGSNTIFELAALKKAMIIIPLPKKGSRGDQIENAKFFESSSLAMHVPQEEFENSKTKDLLEKLKKNKRIYGTNCEHHAKDGTSKVLDEILKACKKEQ